MTQRKISHRNKRRLIIAVVIIVLIALFLWLLPVGLRIGAEKYLTGQGVETQIQDIDLNLFTGKLVITDAHGKNAKGQGFHIGHALFNIDYWPLVRKQIVLSRIELENSSVDIDVDDKGHMAIAGMALGGHAEKEPEKPQKDNATPWTFGVASAKINAVKLHYKQPDFERTITIASSSSQDIVSWQADNTFPLDTRIHIGDGTIHLQGTLHPFGKQIDGKLRLTIDNFKLSQVAPLAKTAGIDNLKGVLDSDLTTQLGYSADKGITAQVSGTLNLKQAHLHMPDTHVDNADIAWQGNLNVKRPPTGDTQLKASGKLSLDNVAVTLPDTLTLQQAGLQWNGDAQLGSGAQGMTVSANGTLTTDKTDLKLLAQKLHLEQGRIKWQGNAKLDSGKKAMSVSATGDLSTKNTALAMPVQGINLKQDTVSWSGKADYTSGDAMRVHAEGSLALDGLDLAMSSQHMAVAGDQLHWSGQVAIDPDAKGVPKDANLPLSVDAHIKASGIKVTDTQRKRTLASLGKLDLSGLAVRGLTDIRGDTLTVQTIAALARKTSEPHYKQHPDIVQINKVTVTPFKLLDNNQLSLGQIHVNSLNGLIYRDAKGNLELTDWLASSDNADQQPNAGSQTQTDTDKSHAEQQNGADTAGFTIDLGKLILSDSQLAVDDRGVKPAFHMQLSKLHVAVADVDSTHPTRGSALNLSSQVGRYGSLQADGTIKPFLSPPSAHLTGNINAVNLAPFSGYTNMAIGRRIKQGTFSAKLNFKLNRGDIDSVADLELTKFHIGGHENLEGVVQHKLGLPLDKILSLLRDSHDNIHLKFPIKGSLQDPGFSIIGVVRKAILGGLTKTIKLVFKPLGLAASLGKGLLNIGDALKFDPVVFTAGQSSLPAQAESRLDKVVEVLKKHPNPQLMVCGHAVPADRKALGLPLPTHTAAGNNDTQKSPSGDESGSQEKALAIARDTLIQLAGKRTDAVGDYLVSKGLKSDRLVPCNPSLGQPANAKPRTSLSL